jgi:hypothetical protein
MAKMKMQYFGLGMLAEGKEDFCQKQMRAFLDHVQWNRERDDEQERLGAAEETDLSSCPAEMKSAILHNDEILKSREPLVPGVEWDVVAIYDNAGIPSIMHRFKRVTNKELFGGSDKVHPAFIIGGEVYDEIYISVYPNTMINGKPYSLPYTEPATSITMEDFAEACFSKGEGWHCLTAAEWGLLANISAKLGTLPHGNTAGGKYHADETEKGVNVKDSSKTLTGSGPATWTHDHTPTGVHDLCGNIWEFCRGCRIVDGSIQAARNNDAALPETDLTERGDDWQPVVDNGGKPVYGSVSGKAVSFVTGEHEADYSGCAWGEVEMRCESEQMKELALYAGEKDAYCYVDSTEGEYILSRGGNWDYGGNAGVFHSDLSHPRSNSYASIGGRSAFFVKH